MILLFKVILTWTSLLKRVAHHKGEAVEDR